MMRIKLWLSNLNRKSGPQLRHDAGHVVENAIEVSAPGTGAGEMARRGVALRARGLGSNVIVTEVDPIRALEAAMDAFQVMPLLDAAPIGDVFITVTGNAHIIRREHFVKMKDGALVCNSGHFDVEIDIPALRTECESVTANVRPNVDEYKLKKGARIYLLGQGRLVNLAAAEGHPPSVMDMSFATQALATEFCVRNKGKLKPAVHTVPAEVEEFVSRHKLNTSHEMEK